MTHNGSQIVNDFLLSNWRWRCRRCMHIFMFTRSRDGWCMIWHRERWFDASNKFQRSSCPISCWYTKTSALYPSKSANATLNRGEEMANSQIAHSFPVIYHLGPIMNHSSTFLFSPELNSTGRQGMMDVLFRNKVTTLTIIMCSNPYYVDIN